jgi:hypothetical protein
VSAPEIRAESRPRCALIVGATAVVGLFAMIAGGFPPVLAMLLVLAGPIVAFTLDRRGPAFFRALLVDGDSNDPESPVPSPCVRGDGQGEGRHSLQPLRAPAAFPLRMRADAGYLGGGLAIVLLAIAFLEWRDPFYFAQDDNLAMGPVALAACRAFFEGYFPTWNPYQFLGQPTSVQSIYGLTYPVTYAVYGIVEALGHETWFFDAFVGLHIVGGYLSTYWAARTLKIRPSLAVAASIAFALSGTALMLGRSYSTMAPLFFWTPLLVVAAESLRRRHAGWRWAVGTGLAIGAFCHSGNAQMWIYAVIFFGLAIVLYLATGEIPRASWPWIVVAAAISIAISLLLVIPQLTFMQSVERIGGGGGRGIGPHLMATLLPMPLAWGDHPEGWGNPANTGAYYYAGTVLTAAAYAGFLALAGVFLVCRGTRALIRDNVWLLCMALALWIACGSGIGPWSAMSALPLFDKFTGPWKLPIFLHLFGVLAGAQLIERLLSAYRVRSRVAVVASAVTIALVLYNVTLTRSAFYDYGDDPYPPLPVEIERILKGETDGPIARVFPVSPDRSRERGFAQSLAVDFATWYEVISAEGYDPFVRQAEYRHAWQHLRAKPVEAARAYGIRWVLVHRTATQKPPLLPGRSRNAMELVHGERQEVSDALMPLTRVRATAPDLVLHEVPDADPLAFRGSGHSLPLKVDQRGVEVDVRGAQRGAAVTVNFLLLPGMIARVDGRPAAIAPDAWNRMVIAVPPGAQRLVVRYAPPWREAWIAAGIVMAFAAIVAMIALRMQRR